MPKELRYRLFRDLTTELHLSIVWRLGIRRMIRLKPCCCGCCAGPVCVVWAAYPSSPGNLFVRPLLAVTRREILSYLETKNCVFFRTDSNNATSVYLRNQSPA